MSFLLAPWLSFIPGFSAQRLFPLLGFYEGLQLDGRRRRAQQRGYGCKPGETHLKNNTTSPLKLSFLSSSAAELMMLDEYPAVPASIAERYKVGRTLGDGNFAVVRECVERSTGREYALKIINKDKCRGKVRVT